MNVGINEPGFPYCLSICSRRRVSVEPGREHPGLQSSVESTFGRVQAGEMAVDTLGLQARCCRSVALCVVSAWKASGDSTVW